MFYKKPPKKVNARKYDEVGHNVTSIKENDSLKAGKLKAIITLVNDLSQSEAE